MGDDPRQLGRHGDQKGLFGFIETALCPLLHHQYAENFPLVDDGHAQEGVEGFLAEALDQLEAGVAIGNLQVERLLALGDEAHQPLPGGQAGQSNLFGIQPLGGTEHQAAGGFVDQVDAADFGAHGLAHPPHDDGQGLRQAIGGIDLLHHIAQGLQHHGDQR